MSERRNRDTNRLSDCETESETIDDFSQYSEQDESKTIPTRRSMDYRPDTPVQRKTSVNINFGEHMPVDVKTVDELSLNDEEEKDYSEDVLVEISKKTTIKKIISRTTSVNGVTQSSETEEIVLRDSHTNEHPRESCPLLGKTSRSTNSFDHTDSIKKDLGFQSPSNKRSEEVVRRDSHTSEHPRESYVFLGNTPRSANSFELSDSVNDNLESRSPSNKRSEDIVLRDSHTSELTRESCRLLEKTSRSTNSFDLTDINQNEYGFRSPSYKRPDDMVRGDSHTSEHTRESSVLLGKTPLSSNSCDLTESAKDNLEFQSPSNKRSDSINITRAPLAFQENQINNQINDNSKTEIERSGSNKKYDDVKDSMIKENDILKKRRNNISVEIEENERKKRSSLKQQQKQEIKPDYFDKESRFRDGKRKESIDTNIYAKSRRLKSEKIDSIMPNKIAKYQSYSPTSTGRIKWTDPFKSYHLKYDLKDNGRSMQNWIKQKRIALDRSDPNQYLKNGTSPETRYPRSRSVNPYDTKNKNRDEIKGYIVQGNIKENLFQIRHPYPQSQKSSSHSPTKSNERKSELTNSYKSFSIETKGSLNNLRKSVPDSTCNSYESRTRGLSQKVSKILDKCDIIKQDFNPLDLKNSWYPNDLISKYNCEVDYFHRPICHCCCCCCSSLYCSFPLNYDCSSSKKYLSNESLWPLQSYSRISKETDLISSSPSRGQSQKREKCTKTRDNKIGSCISTESLDSSPTISEKQIDYLENKLNTLENKIRSIEVNEKKSPFECELDLECQCQDIKKQLDYLYRAIPRIRGAA